MGEALVVELDDLGAIPVVYASGEIDLSTADILREKLSELPADAHVVVVEMSGVTFLDSTALSILVATWKHLAHDEGQGDLRLVITRPAIERVFDVTGLTKVFGIFANLEQALVGKSAR